jgi:hypothetical protein
MKTTADEDSDGDRKPRAISKKKEKNTKIKKTGISKNERIKQMQLQLAALLKTKDDSSDDDDDDDDDDDREEDGDQGSVEKGDDIVGDIKNTINNDSDVIKVPDDENGDDKDDEEDDSQKTDDTDNNDNDDNENTIENNTATFDVVTTTTCNTNNNTAVTINKCGNYEYHTIQHDDRIEVKLPWLESGYAWTELDPNYYVAKKKKKKMELKTIPYDMFPEDGSITREYGIRYYKHLHNNVIPDEAQIINTIQSIASIREIYKTYIMEIIYKFWFDISSKLGLSSPTGLKIRDNKSLVKAFCLIDNEYDLLKIVVVLHIIFDWFKGSEHKNIMDLLEVKFPIKILNVPKITNKRSVYHCIHLLITKVLTNERKNINNNLLSAIKIRVYVTREKEKSKVDENGKKILIVHPVRQHFCVYPWMIRGNFVSNNRHSYLT